jgi:hypothetical protein
MKRALMFCSARRSAFAMAVVASCVPTLLVAQSAGIGARDARAVAAMEQFLARPATAHQYSATRRLEASSKSHRAWLDVQTDFTPAAGLAYEVTAEGGSGFIRSRVLRSLLDEEQKLIARGGSAGITLSTKNYQFTPEGVGDDGLAIVGIRPLRKDRSLIAGHMFLTLEGDLRRVEGRLAKNPSFWVSRVTVVRSYRRVNGVPMPVALESTAQLRLLGSSSLRMTYRYSHIDNRAVDTEQDQ